MNKKKSDGLPKLSPSSTPITRPLSKQELRELVKKRQYGINDLNRYLEKIKKNILVFEEAIAKEKQEMDRVNGMIAVLKNDIQTAGKLKKTAL